MMLANLVCCLARKLRAWSAVSSWQTARRCWVFMPYHVTGGGFVTDKVGKWGEEIDYMQPVV